MDKVFANRNRIRGWIGWGSGQTLEVGYYSQSVLNDEFPPVSSMITRGLFSASNRIARSGEEECVPLPRRPCVDVEVDINEHNVLKN